MTPPIDLERTCKRATADLQLLDKAVKNFIDGLSLSLSRTLPPGCTLRAAGDRALGQVFGVDIAAFPRFVGVGTSNAAVEWRFSAQKTDLDGTQTAVDLLRLYQWPADGRLTASPAPYDEEEGESEDVVCDVGNSYLAYKLVERLVPRLLDSAIFRPRP